ncbi:hypothetical protein D0Z67_21570 [Streptomyces seoulensis]|uniref:DUF6571 domain-containing protein n=1 Tax=Streptomyces seoulensis TaxID=73044 RepID=A0A4P6U0E2_STRSO|nr:DUF6571 family protein [Streptomyces seoulensis]QBJ92622.1 hypothetical protein D0Z67_21570 [Streptomyces seoulensis]
MLDYHTLLHADFTELSEAVNKWRKLPEGFKKVHTQYSNTVEKDLEGSDWKGAGATAALGKVRYVGKQITAAADEAQDVYKLLDDAHEVLAGAQRKLKNLTHDIESDKYLSIKPSGEVYFDPPADTPTENLAALNKGYQESLQAYRSGIRSALDTATEADETLHWALTQDRNGRGKGFNPNSYDSIAAAKKGREQADRDLRELEKLTGKRSKLGMASALESLDPAELRRINTLLSQHEGDPYFAEKFATHLGGKGTLELWTRIADRVQTGDAQTKASADIQKSLSFTLATASHVDSPAMDHWKRDVLAQGSHQIDYLDMARGTTQKGPFGFQVMSSLMRYGSYDREFLNDYGHKLIAYEKSHKDDKPNELWRAEGDPSPYLNFDSKNDQGVDPMAGYMEALGHNPDAAKDLFYSKEWDAKTKVDPDLQYLLEKREWINGNPFAKDQAGYGYDELGHALEAATLGTPYDASDGTLHRDAKTVNIMEQVARSVGEKSDLLEHKPGLSDSLARMGAGYMDDLNWSAMDEGGRGSVLGRDRLFHHDGTDHLNLRSTTANNFLYNVAREEDGYKILSSAQQAFTLGGMEAYRDAPEDAQKVIMNGGYVHGVLDEARISAVDKQFKDATEKINDKLGESAEWKKFGVSQGVGLATGLVLLPVGGPAVSAAAAFVVPTLVEGAASAAETQWGVEIDRETKEKEADLSDKNRMTAQRFSELGTLRATKPALLYMQQHDGKDMTEEVLNAYDRGANGQQRTHGGSR